MSEIDYRGISELSIREVKEKVEELGLDADRLLEMEREWHYAENEAGGSMTSSTFENVANLIYTPSTLDNYLIVASAIIAHDDRFGDDRVETQLVGDGAVLSEGWATPNTDATGVPAENYCFATSKVLELDATRMSSFFNIGLRALTQLSLRTRELSPAQSRTFGKIQVNLRVSLI